MKGVVDGVTRDVRASEMCGELEMVSGVRHVLEEIDRRRECSRYWWVKIPWK